MGLSTEQKIIKRLFDVLFSFVGIIIFSWLIVIAYFTALVETKENGFFIQRRVGQKGKLFNVIKIKTMKSDDNFKTTVTTASDSRITKSGSFFRRTKIDELPQLFNVLIGNMSFVGPRPDVPGFADKLEGHQKNILSVRPGITGPATLYYRNEEELLLKQEKPERYNREVIFPTKVKLNLHYIANYSFWKDIKYIVATIFPSLAPPIDNNIIDV